MNEVQPKINTSCLLPCLPLRFRNDKDVLLEQTRCVLIEVIMYLYTLWINNVATKSTILQTCYFNSSVPLCSILIFLNNVFDNYEAKIKSKSCFKPGQPTPLNNHSTDIMIFATKHSGDDLFFIWKSLNSSTMVNGVNIVWRS